MDESGSSNRGGSATPGEGPPDGNGNNNGPDNPDNGGNDKDGKGAKKDLEKRKKKKIDKTQWGIKKPQPIRLRTPMIRR